MIRLIKDIQIIVFNTNNFYASSPTHFYLYTISVNCLCNRCFPRGSAVKNTAANAGDVGSALGWERSPGEGTGNPLQYSCLGSPMERGVLQATVHRVAKRPSNTTLPLNYNNKRMLTATHNNPKFCELYYFHEVHAFCHVSYKQLPFLVSFILETSFISPCIAPF